MVIIINIFQAFKFIGYILYKFIDPALIRPGRIDKHIYLKLPDVEERKSILKIYASHLNCDDTVDLVIIKKILIFLLFYFNLK